jgi:hypothetical protein
MFLEVWKRDPGLFPLSLGLVLVEELPWFEAGVHTLTCSVDN